MCKQKKYRPKFWEKYELAELNKNEWEALCDGCGKCCLRKIEDADTNEVFYTNVSCKLLETSTARCRNYKMRKKLVPDCIILTVNNLKKIAHWMPNTCGYRRMYYGEPLESWHPLISENTNSAFEAGETVANKIIPETDINEEDLEDFIEENWS
jgi:hypothetical protein